MNKQIPEFLKPYFWDVQFENLDIKSDKQYIISRLYSQGNLRAIKWLKKTYTFNDIQEVAKHSRKLTPLSANYLRQKCNLKKSDMAYYINAERVNFEFGRTKI